MNIRKSLLLTLILLTSVCAGSLLIWQGLNLDTKKKTAASPNQNQVTDQQQQVLSAQTLNSTPSSSVKTDRYLVTKVVDGDTIQIKLNGQPVSIRLIGIDTPETVDPRRGIGCFGKKASAETKRLLEDKEVILTRDVTETDKYGRLLRYVFLPVSGGETLFVNDYLVRQGFAKNYTYPPDVKYNSRFLAAEKEARENLRGLWGECK